MDSTSHQGVHFDDPHGALLPEVAAFLAQLGHSDPVRVPQDVDVREGSQGNEQKKQAKEQGKEPHAAAVRRDGAVGGGAPNPFHRDRPDLQVHRDLHAALAKASRFT